MSERFYFSHRKVVGTGGGRLTLAITITPQGEVYAGYSWCSPEDNFCRKIGRDKASGRARAAAMKRDIYGPLCLCTMFSGKITRSWLTSMFDLAIFKCTPEGGGVPRPQWAQGCKIERQSADRL